jgi:hypothetical protein
MPVILGFGFGFRRRLGLKHGGSARKLITTGHTVIVLKCRFADRKSLAHTDFLGSILSRKCEIDLLYPQATSTHPRSQNLRVRHNLTRTSH